MRRSLVLGLLVAGAALGTLPAAEAQALLGPPATEVKIGTPAELLQPGGPGLPVPWRVETECDTSYLPFLGPSTLVVQAWPKVGWVDIEPSYQAMRIPSVPLECLPGERVTFEGSWMVSAHGGAPAFRDGPVLVEVLRAPGFMGSGQALYGAFSVQADFHGFIGAHAPDWVEATPGFSARTLLTLENRANGPVRVAAELLSAPPGFHVSGLTDSFVVGWRGGEHDHEAESERRLILNVFVPSGTSPGVYEIVLTLRGASVDMPERTVPAVNASLWIRVEPPRSDEQFLPGPPLGLAALAGLGAVAFARRGRRGGPASGA